MVTWETLCTVQQREKLVPSSWISLFALSMRKTHGHCSYSVAVIQKSITFIDYVKGGQLPRMLHFVYRVPKVLQERGQTVSFVILKESREQSELKILSWSHSMFIYCILAMHVLKNENFQ